MLHELLMGIIDFGMITILQSIIFVNSSCRGGNYFLRLMGLFVIFVGLFERFVGILAIIIPQIGNFFYIVKEDVRLNNIYDFLCIKIQLLDIFQLTI